MVEVLYLDDCYLKEFEAIVESVKDDKYVVLNQTAFYPLAGGVAYDKGVFLRNGEEFPVIYTGKFEGKISHEVSKPGLKEGDKITGKIDWSRRYKLMRLHTTAHLLSAIFHTKANAKITGGQIDIEKSRIDFSLENFDREKIQEYSSIANELIKKDMPVKIYYKNREEAMKIPGIIKLANALPPDVETLRIVEIEGVDIQADGGCHVKSLKEIGEIEILKAENKGKDNRRVYYTVKN